MNRYPLNRSVILIDNASIHHSDEAQELCTDFGVVLEFLPAYSPQFAPVETVFYNIKSWIRRSRDWIETLPDDEGVGFTVLDQAVLEVVTPELTANLFRHVDLF
jgi:transposase